MQLNATRSLKKGMKTNNEHQHKILWGLNKICTLVNNTVKSKVLAVQLCPTLCDRMDCSPLGSSVSLVNLPIFFFYNTVFLHILRTGLKVSSLIQIFLDH